MRTVIDHEVLRRRSGEEQDQSSEVETPRLDGRLGAVAIGVAERGSSASIDPTLANCSCAQRDRQRRLAEYGGQGPTCARGPRRGARLASSLFGSRRNRPGDNFVTYDHGAGGPPGPLARRAPKPMHRTSSVRARGRHGTASKSSAGPARSSRVLAVKGRGSSPTQRGRWQSLARSRDHVAGRQTRTRSPLEKVRGTTQEEHEGVVFCRNTQKPMSPGDRPASRRRCL